MEFSETLRHRRMVRHYQPDAVAPASVERIVDAALATPSAGHTQGHSLVIVTDSSQRQRIAVAAGEPAYLDRGFDPWLSVAPVHIVLITHPDRYADRYAERDKQVDVTAWPVPYWWVDAGAALMSVLLAVVDEGLSAGFLGAHAVPDLARVLDLPDEAVPVGIVTVGHAAPDRRSRSVDRGTRPRSETVHRNRWSSG